MDFGFILGRLCLEFDWFWADFRDILELQRKSVQIVSANRQLIDQRIQRNSNALRNYATNYASSDLR